MLLCENLYNNGGTVLEGDNTFQTIGECIEKQIPMKPIDKEFPGAIIYYCPRCGKDLELHPNFCDECSQKIDWGK